jgi:tRNA (cmo5U34)-methyltransferase
MLSHARRRTKRFSRKISFAISDLRNSDWAHEIEGNFDAVVSSLVLHNIRDALRIREIYGEIHSLTKPGGCFLCGDLVAAPGPITGRAYLKARLAVYQLAIKKRTGIEKSLEELEQEWGDRRPGHGAYPHGAPTLIDQLMWLEQAGFDEVDCLWKDTRRAIIAGFRHNP